ncbi:hypothetical protein ABZ281_15910, partial [Streptomyces sp. NPDC006265]
ARHADLCFLGHGRTRRPLHRPDVPGVPKPTALPSSPTVPSSPSAPSGGDDPLCPPVCTAGYGPAGYRTGGYRTEGINLELAELMLKGVQP